MAYTVVLIIHILVTIFLVTTILFQSGKGASLGASMGGGTQAVFGGSGPASLLMKITVACATVFMLTSLYLTYVSGRAGAFSLMKDSTPVIKTVPAPDAEAAMGEATKAAETKSEAKPAPVKASPAPAN